MKKLITGLLIWSVSSAVMAFTIVPDLTHGARTNYTEYFSGCGGNTCSGSNNNFVSNGGAGFAVSSSENSDSSAQAYVRLGADGAPILKAYGNAPASQARWSSAQGVQLFE